MMKVKTPDPMHMDQSYPDDLANAAEESGLQNTTPRIRVEHLPDREGIQEDVGERLPPTEGNQALGPLPTRPA